MATIVAAPPYTSAATESANTGLWSWLTTVDHKRIGVLYLITALIFFVIGGLEAFLIRAQLAVPNGQVLSADMYNQLFTMHGTTMVFLAIMPLSAAFFNFLIPLQIGARDVAFPRLNAFSTGCTCWAASSSRCRSSSRWRPMAAGSATRR
jgi:cytochrome c oxidase subunit I